MGTSGVLAADGYPARHDELECTVGRRKGSLEVMALTAGAPAQGCRACGGELSVTFADLGLQPPSNAFLPAEADFKQEKRYPLRAKVCELCKLVQVDFDVPPRELFSNYAYFSSYSD